ncbi:transporter [Sphaerisporangium siamense]|uniref:DME family drug/metabolite transporter n=1 Tax=Sphaerisporangium siamense TaxID=795645 RepID=A0A7W7G9F5_9ACTN|nr:EamA family transporter [Sphaerisporangium siamense]MBB4698921.1 DME family drug/metabolite transporter [Sphaerisporangium siamense]GII88554.1 transporter [Sphaerisporangium siamense]
MPSLPGAAGPVAVVAAAVLWGTAGTAGALAGVGDPVALAAARLVIGGLVLATATAPAVRRAFAGGHRLPLAVSAVAAAAYQLCFFGAVSRTGVAVGTVVAIASAPVFTGLLAWAYDRARPGRRWSLATAAAVAGCAALVLGGRAVGADPLGVLLALTGGFLYAFYAVAASRAIRAGAPSGGVMAVLFGGAGLLLAPILLWRGTAWLGDPHALLTVVYLGCATTALAAVLYGRGLRATPVARAATLTLAEPAVAALLGLLILHERLGAVSWAGLALLGVALVVVALPEPARPAPAGSAVTAQSSA